MGISEEQKKREIVRLFQRSFKGHDVWQEIEAIPLAELRAADEMTGRSDVNDGWRLRLRNRIKDIEDAAAVQDQRQHDSKVRALGWVMQLAIALIAGILLGKYLL